MDKTLDDLRSAISLALVASEEAGDLVIAVPSAMVADRISEAVRSVFTGSILSPQELLALSGLISEAVADPRFYDWEMPTKLGYSAQQMADLGRRLRGLTSI